MQRELVPVKLKKSKRFKDLIELIKSKMDFDFLGCKTHIATFSGQVIDESLTVDEAHRIDLKKPQRLYIYVHALL